MAKARGDNPSSLLVEEYFANADDRFLDAILTWSNPKALARLTEKWKRDTRPWARRQMLRYLEMPLTHPGHEVVVKRLFKQAEHQQDHELMAAFLVAFDRLVRRVLRAFVRWDWQTRNTIEHSVLVASRNSIPPVRGGEIPTASIARGGGRRRRAPRQLFRNRTRYYLRRRAWRYFRRLGFQAPSAYVPGVVAALARYTDADFASGENILDNWSLLQICFRHHEALDFGATHVYVREGHALAELSPAPRFPKLWAEATAYEPLLTLVTTARSRLVRVWALDLLRRAHPQQVARLDPLRLIPLLADPDPQVQQFAAEIFAGLENLGRLELSTWLQLLENPQPAVLAIVSEAMSRHVTPERLTLVQCIALACAKPTPVARLGFSWLQQRALTPEDIATELPRLAEAQCAALGYELGRWALQHLGAPGAYRRPAAVAFFDSLLAEMRAAALEWLEPPAPGYSDPGLWACLLETPFADVRERLLAVLERRSAIPGAGPADLAPLWCAVLLGVHRGGRQKPKAVRQVAAALAEEPARFAALGPILAVAVRSIRGPERRAGLAAVATLLERRPELAGPVGDLLPELSVVALAGGPA